MRSRVLPSALLVLLIAVSIGLGQDNEGIRINDRITITGLVEIEAFVEDRKGDTESDVVLATVQICVSAEINEILSADLVLLWQEDDTEPVDIDEGYLTASLKEWTIRAGKLCVPFGSCRSHFVTDPLTLELGETRESALAVTYSHDPIEISAAAYNGDVEINGGNDNSINNVVVCLQVSPIDKLTFGVSWARNIADSNGLQDEFPAPVEIEDVVPGIAAFMTLSINNFTLEAEYVGALDDFEPAELDSDGDGSGDRPVSFNTELAYTVRDDLEVAVRYETSDEFLALPESRFGACLCCSPMKHTTLSFEIMHSDFEAFTGQEDALTFTTHVAVEF